MAVVMKTPGVYIVEKDAFPNSIVEVETAVPAFVGYTERADNKGKSLRLKPKRISSMAEYHSYFGFGPEAEFTLGSATDLDAADFLTGTKPNIVGHTLTQSKGRYLLYHGMRQFFQNGGGPCFVVSVGSHDQAVTADKLTAGIEALVAETEPTMVVVPDAVLLTSASNPAKPYIDCIGVQQAMLKHCGEMKSRVAILDVWGGHRPKEECIPDFRDNLGINHLDFAAAYYPWLHTTVVQENELSYRNVAAASRADLVALLNASVVPAAHPTVAEIAWTENQWSHAAADPAHDPGDAAVAPPATPLTEAQEAWVKSKKRMLHDTLTALSPLYKTLCGEMRKKLNLLPPSAAMAGIYTMVDNTRGVWKAPANVSLNGVVEPAVNLSAQDQADLNVTPQGKSINAIRSFIGEGVLVWGARTLDGNNQDWRYLPVRRTAMMVEQSIRAWLRSLVFAANDANTWACAHSAIEQFLNGIWQAGGLQGAKPADAFAVQVGLGTTMTADDLLDGVLRVNVLLAITHPAEFIVIAIEQPLTIG